MRFLRPALASALLLAAVPPAPAQTVSRWGNPVISLGWTPYHALSAGFGNVAGRDGFIPGYGYYPGPLPSHYPWLTGPQDRPPARPSFLTPPGDEAFPPGAAVLRVRVPADAELWFSGSPTSQRGSQRRFVTPAIADGGHFDYEVRARWREAGRLVEQRRSVRVHAGDRVTVDFTPADQ